MKRALLALTVACTVGPSYHVPKAPLPRSGRYKEGGPWRVASPSDAMLRGNWWRVFREPELDALELRVAASNQTIAQAFYSLMAARDQIRIARAQYFPTVTAAPSVVHSRGGAAGAAAGSSSAAINPASQTGSGAAVAARSGVVTEYSLPLEASWAPDLFGRIRNQVRESQYNAQVSAADLESQRLLAQATLAQTYFELRGQDALQQLLDDTVAADTQVAELARSRFDTGVDTEVAVVQAEETLQTARVQATNAGILRAQYEHAIAMLVGEPATAFSLPRRALLAAPPTIPTGAPSRLLERRPDIASAERKMAAANAAIGVGYAAYYPDVTLTGSLGFASTAIGSLLSWPSRVWSLGASAAEIIFDGGLRGATIDQAIANYNAAVAAYRQSVLAAFQNVEDELAATTILAHEIDQQRDAVRLAERAFELEKGRYETGIDPYIDLMQQQALLLAARQTLVTLQVQQMTSAVALVEALGGGWDRAELPTPAQVTPRPPNARTILR